ncbi:protein DETOXIFICATION 45, chloroplastic-like isoform X2 [Beta vulgaris subsp. vulgaris]|uniref:protein DETOXIFICATION 45, chloroplastic-like isoform X2 n=1 Tax=Beta vulgaris subsp. vulgaris TaxID=3555 RepID=UPI002036D3C1|nr:protein DETOXIFICATION 45, chloroplastic-like isoform X2 [Beta vulgaris subsp. vulgaris]
MTAAQLCGGKISAAFASTRRRWSMANKTSGSNSMGRSFGSCSSLAAIRKRCEDVSGRYYLSADRRKFSQEAVIRCRKPFQNVTYSLVSSECSMEPCDVEDDSHDLVETVAEEASLKKDDDNGVSESVFQPPNQLPPQNVKRELIMLSLPALASQAIDPMAQLMETAYIGRLGAVQLASAGVSMSIFNIISKLFNIPLLSVATSFVAEDISKSSSDGHEEFERKQLSSVSTALLLAAGIGIIEALALLLGTGSFLSLMGISSDSPMRVPAQRFLSLRALGAPAVVMSLALQGILRGFKDTKTPVFCLGVANLAAVFMFPLFIYYFQMGVTGAATATVVSQYIGSFLMIWFLSKRAILLPPKLGDLNFGVYLKSGGFLIGRTLAVLITMTIGTSMAARQGPLAMAAHQICMQVWLAVSLLTDALAASGQALVASSLSKGDYNTVKELTNFVLKIGIITGTALAVLLGSSFGSLANLFTKDYAVLQIVKSGTWFVSASQPLNSLAFIFDGLHYGASDFPYAACSMILVGAISSAVLLYAPSVIGLRGVWLGLTLFMGLRMAAGFFRIQSKNGPWWFLHTDSQ